jgi:acyl-CoA synthetase (AMP-forming)/AMP-acid ligase II
MAGAVLNTLNTRLDAEAIAFMLEHGEARLLITDREFAPTIEAALKLVKHRITVVDAEDPQFTGGKRLGELTYEQLLAEGDADFAWRGPPDEWEAISLNYTSGTTGNPSSSGACRTTRSICGRCRCSTATAGASRGPWRRTPAPMSACARWRPRLSST